MGHVPGAEKGIFLIRGRGRPTVYGGRASGILSIRGPEVSPGSLRVEVYMASRLQRMHGRFQHISANSLNHPNHSCMNYLAMASRALGGPKHRRMRRRRLPTTRPTPRDLQEPICPRKKCVIWARWRPVPVKNVNYPRPPRNRNSGLVGPHTTPPIVNYKYMTSTL